MTSTELVGPLPTVEFRGGVHWRDPNPPKVVYTPPRNTLDPRYNACTEHHVACDCREAEAAEYRQESRLMRQEVEREFVRVLAGHPTYAFSEDGRTETGCQCTGCQIARAAHMPYWKWI